MLYEKIHKGHTILFWPICSIKTLWSATENFLFIDGILAAKSGGFCFQSKAKATTLNGDSQMSVEIRTKTSFRGLSNLDFELLVDNEQIDSGLLQISFMWKVPDNIEQVAVALSKNKTAKLSIKQMNVGQNVENVINKRVDAPLTEQVTPIRKKTPSVFLSHSTIDKPIVRKIAERLKQEDISVWIDEAEIRIGDSLIEKIGAAIHDTDYVAAIISRHSIKSAWVKKELSLAMTKEINGKRITVLPILVEECDLPFFLSDKLYAVLTSSDKFEMGCLQIIKTVKGVGLTSLVDRKQIPQITHSNDQLDDKWALGSRPTGVDRPQEAFGALRSIRNTKYLAAILAFGGMSMMALAFSTVFIKEFPLTITRLMLYTIGSLAVWGPTLWFAATRLQRAYHNDANLLMSFEENGKDGFNIPFGPRWWRLYRMGRQNIDYRVGFWLCTIACLGLLVSVYFLISLAIAIVRFSDSIN